MDAKLFDIASLNEISFSRYADDLAFSGKEIKESFIDQMMTIITDEGFEVNHNKTQLRNSKSRKILTGIEITGGKITIPRALKRKLRQKVYFVSKFGLLNHLENQNNFDPIFLERLLGKLSFWKHVDPSSDYVNKAIDSINKLRGGELDSVVTRS
jgi:RNA-directed DNA polymerase